MLVVGALVRDSIPRIVKLETGAPFTFCSVNNSPGVTAARSDRDLIPWRSNSCCDRATMLMGTLLARSERFLAVTMISPPASLAARASAAACGLVLLGDPGAFCAVAG